MTCRGGMAGVSELSCSVVRRTLYARPKEFRKNTIHLISSSGVGAEQMGKVRLFDTSSGYK